MEEQEPKPQESQKLLGRPRIRIGAVVALAVAGGLIAWAVVDSEDTGPSASGPVASSAATTSTTATANPIAPVGLSAKGLKTLIASVGQPIYWAGPKPGYQYELTRTSTGNVFIRYLPPGVKVGVKQASYLIIATYPYRNALQALKGLADRPKLTIPGGGIAIVDQKDPKSVHLAYPGVNDQVEVYDPSPARSVAVAKSGTVRPVPPPA
jgi:hypothetical protein